MALYPTVNAPGPLDEPRLRKQIMRAASIIEPDPPKFLVDVLADGSFHVLAASAPVPTRKELQSSLVKLESCAAALYRQLRVPGIHGVLSPHTEGLEISLLRLQRYAETARASRTIIDDGGKIRRGRTRAHLPGRVSSEATAAAVVAEAWTFFHKGKFPVYSLKTAEAADVLWHAHLERKRVAPGAEPLNRWKDHFLAAAKPEAESLRQHVQRSLTFLSNLEREMAEERQRI